MSSAIGGTLATLLLLTACGNDESPDDQATEPAVTTETTTTTTSPRQQDREHLPIACNAFTDEQIERVAGRMPAEQIEGAEASTETGASSCYWKDADGNGILLTTMYAPPMDVAAKIAEQRENPSFDDQAPSPDVGDESFFFTPGPYSLGTLVMRSGDNGYLLRLHNPTDSPATPEQLEEGRQQVVELARIIVDQ